MTTAAEGGTRLKHNEGSIGKPAISEVEAMGDGWEERSYDRDSRMGMVVFGVILVVVGGLFLASEQFGVSLSVYWPLYVIVPGVALWTIGLILPHEGGMGMAIPGGMVATVGLILAFQNSTDSYSSWAYAWSLVAPGSVGMTMSLWAALHRRGDLLDAGLRTWASGVGLFVGFGLFFVNIIRIDGGNEPQILRMGFPFLAVFLGVLIVIISLLPRPRSAAPTGTAGGSDPWTSGQNEPPK